MAQKLVFSELMWHKNSKNGLKSELMWHKNSKNREKSELFFVAQKLNCANFG